MKLLSDAAHSLVATVLVLEEPFGTINKLQHRNPQQPQDVWITHNPQAAAGDASLHSV
jgi:hypothetical protein